MSDAGINEAQRGVVSCAASCAKEVSGILNPSGLEPSETEQKAKDKQFASDFMDIISGEAPWAYCFVHFCSPSLGGFCRLNFEWSSVPGLIG